MKIREVIKKIYSLLDNAEELKNEEYIELFESALNYLCDYDQNTTLLRTFDEVVREELGPEKHMEISVKAAKAAFRKNVENMEDSDFKKFTLENIDKITSDAGY